MSALDEMLLGQFALLDMDDRLAVDTEDTGLHVGHDDLCIGLSLSQRDISIYIPLAHAIGENVDDTVYETLKDMLEHWNGPLIFANVVFDVVALYGQGIDLRSCTLRDVIVMAHMLNENMPRSKSLDSLSHHYLGVDEGKVVDTEGDVWSKAGTTLEYEKTHGWPNTTWQMMWLYAITDTELTEEIYDVLEELLKKELGDGYDAFMAHKSDFFKVLIAMYIRGVRVDIDDAQSHVLTAESAMNEQREVLQLGPKDKVGPLFLKRVLHEELQIPVLKETKGGAPAFDKEAMELYEPYIERAQSPVGKALKVHRGWQKASSAASKPYLELVEKDGRVRCSYKMHGTVTGRLSCEKPNLQQIPKEVKPEDGKPWAEPIKGLFIPQDGYTLVNADFSQLELRLGTAYAGEQALKDAYEEGRDVFTEMADTLGWPRQRVKTFVYATNYGAGPKKHAATFGISEAQAKKMIRDYQRAYPRFAMTAQTVTRQVERKKQIKLWSGRIRHFQYPSEGYKGWNSLVQGGSADLMERCMVHCFKTLDNDDCRILLQVHDSLTWEIRTELVDEMMPKIQAAMEAVTEYTGREFGVRWHVDVGLWSKKEEARVESYRSAHPAHVAA